MSVTIDKLLGEPLLHDHTDDNNELYIRKTNDDTPDIGAEQGSSADGITADYIADKLLSRVRVSGTANDEEGAIRFVSGVFQIYANGVWNDIVINFVFREDSATGSYELEHQPVGLEYYYEVASGNSNARGIDGKPLIQQYTSTPGAYQPDLLISGGDF